MRSHVHMSHLFAVKSSKPNPRSFQNRLFRHYRTGVETATQMYAFPKIRSLVQQSLTRLFVLQQCNDQRGRAMMCSSPSHLLDATELCTEICLSDSSTSLSLSLTLSSAQFALDWKVCATRHDPDLRRKPGWDGQGGFEAAFRILQSFHVELHMLRKQKEKADMVRSGV